MTVTIPLSLVIELAAERLPFFALAKLILSWDTGLSFASNTVALTVLVLMPSAVRLLGVAVSVMVVTGPAINSTVTSAFTPPEVAMMVAVSK